MPSVRVERAPMCLISLSSVETLRCWLPRLIESFEVEHVNIPVKRGAYTFFVEGLRIVGACNGGAFILVIMVVGAAWIDRLVDTALKNAIGLLD